MSGALPDEPRGVDTPRAGAATPIRIGTRRSELALVQARSVADEVRRSGHPVELVEVTTQGDRHHGSLASIGGAGVFVNALRDALFDGRIDVAVHSFKDLPTAEVDGLMIAAVPPRADPRDILVTRDGATLSELPDAARIGTGSPRRAAQVRLLRDDVKIADIRGNVDTRLQMVTDGDVDAVILARAGLTRLGRLDVTTQTFAPDELLPAPAQGALAVECRAGGVAEQGRGDADVTLAHIVAALDNTPSRATVTAERAVLSTLEAGCAAPVGAFAEAVSGDAGDELSLRAAAVAVDGSTSVRLSIAGPLGNAAQLGRQLATELLAEGASRLIEEHLT